MRTLQCEEYRGDQSGHPSIGNSTKYMPSVVDQGLAGAPPHTFQKKVGQRKLGSVLAWHVVAASCYYVYVGWNGRVIRLLVLVE
jgi:hypothetical protein